MYSDRCDLKYRKSSWNARTLHENVYSAYLHWNLKIKITYNSNFVKWKKKEAEKANGKKKQKKKKRNKIPHLHNSGVGGTEDLRERLEQLWNRYKLEFFGEEQLLLTNKLQAEAKKK